MKKVLLIFIFIFCVLHFIGCNFCQSKPQSFDKLAIAKQNTESEIIDTFVQNRGLILSCVEEIQSMYLAYGRETMQLRLSEDGGIHITCGNPIPSQTKDVEETIENLRIQEILSLSTVKIIVVGKDGIEFAGEGKGYGSNTSYCGIFFSQSNDMTGLPYYSENMVLAEDENSIYGTEKDGDNSFYIERIELNYFYYEANF